MTVPLDERVELLERKVERLADERLKPLEEKVKPLVAQVNRLDTWAGPGQNASLAGNLADLRKRFDEFGKVQARHTTMLRTLNGDVATLKTDVATLKADVAGLKSDMVEVRSTLGEILDRLPPRQEPRGA